MQFDYDEIENSEFIGMKRPIILQDELARKHEEQRKLPQSQLPVISVISDVCEEDQSSISSDSTIPHYKEDGILFVDVQTGKYCAVLCGI